MNLNEIAALGHALLGLAFVFAGLRNIANRELLSGLISRRGVPLPRISLFAGIAIQLLAGCALIFGFQVTWALMGLALFLIGATYISFDFWRHTGPDRYARINGFVANAALIGAIFAALK